MLAIATNISAYTIQPPLVNTTTPGTSVVHVPYDNVAPSVSGSQVDNNTKGNGSVPTPAQEQASPAADTSAASLSSAANNASNALNTSTQATFIAQLAAQDSSPETHIILLQYEKLVEISNVKYKPSNAFKPSSDLAGVFGNLVAHSKAPVKSVPPQPEISTVQKAAPQTPIAETSAPPVSTDTNLNTDISVNNTAPEPQPAAAPPVVTPQPQAVNAYIASLARVALQSITSESAVA